MARSDANKTPAKFVDERVAFIRANLEVSADIGQALLDANYKDALDKLKEKYEQKKGKIKSDLKRQLEKEGVRLVSNFWGNDADTIRGQYIGGEHVNIQ